MPRILNHIIDARHLVTPNHKQAQAQLGGAMDFAALLAEPGPLLPETRGEAADKEAVEREDGSSRDGDQPPPQEQPANPVLTPAWNPLNLSTAVPPLTLCTLTAGSTTQASGQSATPAPPEQPDVRPEANIETQAGRQPENDPAPQPVQAYGIATLKQDDRHADEDSHPATGSDHDKQRRLPAVAQDQTDDSIAMAVPDAPAGPPVAASDTAASPIAPASQRAVPQTPAPIAAVHAAAAPEPPAAQAPARQILALLDAPGAALPMSANPILNASGASGEIRVLRMKLRPEALGDVDVTLRRRGADMRIDITVTTQAAADALQTDLGLLKERVGSLLRPEGAQSIVVAVQSADNLPSLQGGAAGDAGGAMGGSFAAGGGERSPSRKRETPFPAREGDSHEETRLQPVSADLVV